MTSSSAAWLRDALGLIEAEHDILHGRVESPAAPWAEARGWSDYLGALDDEAVTRAERDGLAHVVTPDSAAPASLRALCAAIDRALGPLATAGAGGDDEAPLETKCVPRHKQRQIAALVRLFRTRWPALGRVVDFGAGKGHLARSVARDLGVPALGIDREPSRVDQARALAGTSGATFDLGDEHAPVGIGPGDLMVGLHACGQLGDAVVRRAVGERAHVLLVSCCLQKIAGTARAPLSQAGAPLVLPKPILGLTNVALLATDPRATRGRATRRALRLLLASRGLAPATGEEAQGINRRQFRHGLGAVAPAALRRRGLPAPTPEEIAHFERCGTDEHARMRRLSLPRTALGRLVEAAVALDRATFLEEAGYQTTVEIAFSHRSSPRNLAVVAVAPGPSA